MKAIKSALSTLAAVTMLATQAQAVDWVMATTSNDASYQTRNAKAFAEDIERLCKKPGTRHGFRRRFGGGRRR